MLSTLADSKGLSEFITKENLMEFKDVFGHKLDVGDTVRVPPSRAVKTIIKLIENKEIPGYIERRLLLDDNSLTHPAACVIHTKGGN